MCSLMEISKNNGAFSEGRGGGTGVKNENEYMCEVSRSGACFPVVLWKTRQGYAGHSSSLSRLFSRKNLWVWSDWIITYAGHTLRAIPCLAVRQWKVAVLTSGSAAKALRVQRGVYGCGVYPSSLQHVCSFPILWKYSPLTDWLWLLTRIR